MTYLHRYTRNARIFSKFLQRWVELSVILPANYSDARGFRLLLFNDGQDLRSDHMDSQLAFLHREGDLENVIIAGIHADHNRLQEYGTAIRADYAQRGGLAHATANFVITELLPFLKDIYKVQTNNVVYAGFSLGGLMALDIVWNHPEYFSSGGVFSGALWWREKSIEGGYTDADRIMHGQIRNTSSKPVLKFWFQAGTSDETDDRDGDGVIDSIQDTLECISELEKKGYRWGTDIRYVEVKDGEHNVATWAGALPDFCKWAFKDTHLPSISDR